jgi:predicted esterase YcpF (UPF0227 family)
MEISQNSVEVQLSEKSKNLYLFFGGIAAGIAMPPFEFYNSAKIIDENKIFIRDFEQCWYQKGLPGISNDIQSTAKYIQKWIKKIKPEKIFFVGNSMGGYAAILFATLIGRGEVIAFAPQTFISPVLRLRHIDARWSSQILKTYFKSSFKTKVWDTKTLLKNKKSSQKISIFVSKDDRLDYIHALHLKSLLNVKVFEFDGGGHGIVKLLRDQGKLPAIMSGSYA